MSAQVIQGTPVEELNATHRCDGCGAQAYVKVNLLEGELLFCKNHYERPGTEEKMTAIAVSIQDERPKLFAPRVFPDDE